jgi:thiamine biosynthesis lipoprotein
MDNRKTLFHLKISVVILTVLLLSALVVSCTGKRMVISDTRIALGTYVKISIVTNKKNNRKAFSILEQAFKKITEYDVLFDYRSENGALEEFNQSEILKREDNQILFDLVYDALQYATLTDGYFDPTILPVVRLWGFDTDSPHLPSAEDVRSALEKVGYKNVSIHDGTIVKPRYIQFDLSGVAKGKIVDLVRLFLIENGFYDFLIDAGGDIYVCGFTDKNRKWRIAIQDPVHSDRFSGILEKTDRAIVTSGDYERFFIENGRRYSHLFNPKTGYPFSDCKSVTIIAEDTAFADAMSTAVFVMGSRRGYKFLERMGIEGLIMYMDGDKLKTRSTPGFWD